jgi:hypothetical protein
MGKMEIPCYGNDPAEKIEIQSEVKISKLRSYRNFPWNSMKQ